MMEDSGRYTNARMRPEHLHYDAIEQYLQRSIKEGKAFLFDSQAFEKELRRLWEEYDVPYQSLQSLIRNLHVSHVKKTASQVKSTLASLIDEYVQGRSIKELARKTNYPPYLLSRFIVETICITENFVGGRGKKGLADAMRHPLLRLGSLDVIAPQYRASETNAGTTTTVATTTTTTSTRLAREVQLAMDDDPMYGPRHDKDRHMVGVEFEVVLEYKLKALNISFENEEQLRDRGTARTPDVLLSVPLGIEVPKKDGSGTEWKIICWIDSKASFGDVNTHRTSVLPQAESYVHRFGPGLVLYWFGHAPLNRLSDAQGDIAIFGWDVPDKFMLPTGELLTNATGGA